MKKILLITAFTFSCLQIQASEELTSGQACELGLNPTNTESEESTVNNTKENSTLNDNTVAQLNDETVTQFNEELSTRLQKLNSMNYPMNCLRFLKQIPNFLDFLLLVAPPIAYFKVKNFDNMNTVYFTLNLFFSSAINIGSKKYLSNHITNSSMIEKNIRCLDIAMVGSLVSYCFLIALIYKAKAKDNQLHNFKNQDFENQISIVASILTSALNLGSFVFKSYKMRKQLTNKRKYLKNKQETKEELPLPSKA